MGWIKRITVRIPRKSMLRGAITVASGTVGAQALAMLAAPLLTRLYSPVDYGLLAVYAAFIGFCSVIACWRYPFAIALPESRRDAAVLVRLGVWVSLLTSLLVLGVVALLHRPIAIAFGDSRVTWALWILPFATGALGIYQVFSNWAIREKSFKTVAQTKLSQSIFSILYQLIGASWGAFSLVIGHTLGLTAGVTRLVRFGWSQDDALKQSVSTREMISAAKQYYRFPLYSTPAGLLHALGQYIPAITFASWFGGEIAGAFMLTQRVLTLPLTLVGEAVSNVMLSKAPESARQDRLGSLVSKVHRQLSLFAMPPMALLLLAGPSVFSFVFGERWRLSGDFAQWMSPWLYLVFVTSPLASVEYVGQRQAQGLLFETLMTVVRLAGMGYGAWVGDSMLAIRLFAVGSAICWGCMLLWMIRVSGCRYRTVLGIQGAASAWSLLLAAPLLTTLFLHASETAMLIAFVVSIGLILLFYIGMFRSIGSSDPTFVPATGQN